jgi:hypothetical protein
MDIENKGEREAEERMHCLFAQMYITHGRFHSFYPRSHPGRHLLSRSLASVSHKRKKVN